MDGPGRDDELAESIQQLCALEMSVRLRRLAQMAEFDRHEAWRADGATSMAGWAMAACGPSRRSAEQEVKVALALETLPAIAKAAEAGALSWDQLVAVVEMATPATDADLAAEAPGWTAGQLQALARAARRRRNDEAVFTDERRRLDLRPDLRRGGWRVSGRLGDAEGAVAAAALARMAEANKSPDTDGNFDNIFARQADAFVELASSYLGRDSDADRACIVVHANIEGFFDDEDGFAEIQDGPALAAETLRRLACDSRWQIVIDNRDGTPAGIGRTSRQIPPWLARALRHRDRHCRFPGCERTRWTHGHHLVHWIDDGPTDLSNLATLCGRHHHLVHEEGWALEGDGNDTLRFISPNGRVLSSRPTPLRPDIKDRFFGPDPPEP